MLPRDTKAGPAGGLRLPLLLRNRGWSDLSFIGPAFQKATEDQEMSLKKTLSVQRGRCFDRVNASHHAAGNHLHDGATCLKRNFQLGPSHLAYFDSNFVPKTLVASTYRNQFKLVSGRDVILDRLDVRELLHSSKRPLIRRPICAAHHQPLTTCFFKSLVHLGFETVLLFLG